MTWGDLRCAGIKLQCFCRSCGREMSVDVKRVSIRSEASLSEALALLKCKVCGEKQIEAKP